MPSGTVGLIVAAVLFVVGIGVGLILFYLISLGRRQRPVTAAAPAKGGRILLPFSGESAPRQALEVAINLARARDAKLVLFYVAIVPVTLNIEAELTREVEKGFNALEKAEQIAKWSGVDTEIRLERERTARRGMIEMLKREPFDSMVIEMKGAGPGLKLERQIEDISYLFQRVKEEVVIVRSSRETAVAPRGE
ncbi:MAG: universal stress protein [Actinobacteria bacterium]|nr:universal stress protein [Actinomycetota bacterium]